MVHTVILLIYLSILLFSAWEDLRTRTITPVPWWGFVVALILFNQVEIQNGWVCGIGTALIMLPFWYTGMVGMGDVTVMSATCLFLGMQGIWSIIFAAVIMLLHAGIMVIYRRTRAKQEKITEFSSLCMKGNMKPDDGYKKEHEVRSEGEAGIMEIPGDGKDDDEESKEEDREKDREENREEDREEDNEAQSLILTECPLLPYLVGGVVFSFFHI